MGHRNTDSLGSASWSRFWKEPGDEFDKVMEVSTLAAARKLHNFYNFKPSDLIFDFGCGPGFLVGFLKAKGIRVVGGDISERIIVSNKRRYPGAKFIVIEDELTGEGSISDKLGETEFDYVILLSVVQYFSEHSHVARVISILKRHLKKGGRIVLADVVTAKTSRVRDGIAALSECLRRGRTIAFVRFVLHIAAGTYKAISQHQPLLILDDASIERIATQTGMDWRKLPSMTVHPSRTSYEFSFIVDP